MELSKPKNDLEIAQRAIGTMKKTTDFFEFRENWENYLIRIERAWALTEHILSKQRGFQQWYAPYRNLRKKDSLLIFLRQARNAEMHCSSTTIGKPSKIVIVDKSGRGFRVNSISGKLEKGVLTINLDSPDILLNLDFGVAPTNPQVTRFKVRGKWYNPPWHHLHNRISDLHPVSIAELGLDFYNTYVNEAEHWKENSASLV